MMNDGGTPSPYERRLLNEKQNLPKKIDVRIEQEEETKEEINERCRREIVQETENDDHQGSEKEEENEREREEGEEESTEERNDEIVEKVRPIVDSKTKKEEPRSTYDIKSNPFFEKISHLFDCMKFENISNLYNQQTKECHYSSFRMSSYLRKLLPLSLFGAAYVYIFCTLLVIGLYSFLEGMGILIPVTWGQNKIQKGETLEFDNEYDCAVTNRDTSLPLLSNEKASTIQIKDGIKQAGAIIGARGGKQTGATMETVATEDIININTESRPIEGLAVEEIPLTDKTTTVNILSSRTLSTSNENDADETKQATKIHDHLPTKNDNNNHIEINSSSLSHSHDNNPEQYQYNHQNNKLPSTSTSTSINHDMNPNLNPNSNQNPPIFLNMFNNNHQNHQHRQKENHPNPDLNSHSCSNHDLNSHSSRLHHNEEAAATATVASQVHDIPPYTSPTSLGEEEIFQHAQLSLVEKGLKEILYFVNNKLTAPSDYECFWSWGNFRCEPYCECRLQYRVGDYHPNRSCRRIKSAYEDVYHYHQRKLLELNQKVLSDATTTSTTTQHLHTHYPGHQYHQPGQGQQKERGSSEIQNLPAAAAGLYPFYIHDTSDSFGSCDPSEGLELSLSERFGNFLVGSAKKGKSFLVDHVLPSTDEECKFDFERSIISRQIKCIPENKCESIYKFGDMHLGRTCRLMANIKSSSSTQTKQEKGEKDKEGDDEMTRETTKK